MKSKVISHFVPLGIKAIQEIEVQEIDGLRIVFKDESWILFRLSGTERRARIYVESNSVALSTSLLGQGVEMYGSL